MWYNRKKKGDEKLEMTRSELIDCARDAAMDAGWVRVMDIMIDWADRCLYGMIAEGLQDLAATARAEIIDG